MLLLKMTLSKRNQVADGQFRLVHGPLSGGWCWKKVKSLLESKGHKVTAPDLPGHEPDSLLPPSEITM